MEKRVMLTKNGTFNYNTYFFTESSLRTIEAAMRQVFAKATQMIFTKEDLVESLFFIKSGEVKLYKVTKEGKEFVLTILSSGDMFGEVSSFTSNNYTANAKALTDCEIGIINHKKLKHLLHQDAVLAMEFLRWSSLMERTTNAKLRDLTHHGKKGAICSTLIRLANSYGEKEDSSILITKKIKNGELGNYIGAFRESVNRMLGELKKDRVISQDGGYLKIHDLDYLKLACDCEECPIGVCRM